MELRKKQISQENEKKYIDMRAYLMENVDSWDELELRYPDAVKRARAERGSI